MTGNVETIQDDVTLLQQNQGIINANNWAGADGINKAQGWKVIMAESQNMDLNGITDFGTYYCNSATTAENVANRPPISPGIFRLEVKGLVPNASREFVYREQWYYVVTAVFRRYTADGGTLWTEWRTVVSYAVLITDADDAMWAGDYSYNSGCSNVPENTVGGAMSVVRYNANYVKQMCFPNKVDGPVYVRVKHNGTWQSWKQIQYVS